MSASRRSTSLSDSSAEIERMESTGSWDDALDWFKLEVQHPASRSVSHHANYKCLLEAERAVVEGHGVVLINTDEAGTLIVTNLRLIFLVSEVFSPFLYSMSEGTENIIALGTIPLATIEKFSKMLMSITCQYVMLQSYGNARTMLLVVKNQSAPRQAEKTPSQRLLQVIGRDMRIIVFGFRPKTKQRRAIYDGLLRCTKPSRPWDLYAFSCGQSKFTNANPKVRLLNECFRLLGKGFCSASIDMIDKGSYTLSNELWRISNVNSNYIMCPSYPFALIVPKSISDEEVVHASSFRSKGRLPVVSWCHPGTGAVLARSSQPLVGLMMNMRSNTDEKLVAALCSQLGGDKKGRRKLYIADARPRKNALANVAMGGGSESPSHYFQSENYSAWAFQFQIFVKGKELWGHIAGTIPAPDSEQEKEKYVKWEVKDAQIMSWILGSMEHSMLLNLKPYKSSREMWDYLKKVYNQSNTARRFQLELELGQLSQGSMSIQEFYSSFVNLWAEYTDIVYASVPLEGLVAIQSVHETSKRDQFLMKLRGEFEAIRSNLMNREPVPFLDICVGELLREEQRIITQAVLEQKAQNSTPIPVAYAAQGRSKGGRNMSNIQCYSCKGFGHIATTCTKKFCNYCKKPGHIIKDCSIRPPKKSETAYNVSVVFFGIDNIHAMRESLSRLRDYLDTHGSTSSDGKLSLLRHGGWTWGGGNLSSMSASVATLGDSGWLIHVQSVLAGSAWIAARVALESASVLVHCSDGWDRTSQLISLANLLLDPYYRTFTGFQVFSSTALIEKDWLAFGHPFEERMGMPTVSGCSDKPLDLSRQSSVGSFPSSPMRQSSGSFAPQAPSSSHAQNQYSPIFLQWIDCVSQLLRMYPFAFEFSSAFLVDLLDSVLSCRFGNFFCNSEKERQLVGVSESCGCLWAYLADLRSSEGRSHVHYNLFYSPLKHNGPLLPPAAALAPTLWPQFHLRWACPSEAEAGELEAQCRNMSLKFSELQKAKEGAEKKAKETTNAMESLSAELQNEKRLSSSAMALAKRASKESAAIKRAIQSLGCKVHFAGGGDTTVDIETNPMGITQESVFSHSKRESDGIVQHQYSSDLSISISAVTDDVVSNNPLDRVCDAICPSRSRDGGCRWPEAGCAQLCSQFIGVKANYDAIDSLSIYETYFDTAAALNSNAKCSRAGADN
ncbi:hypothetical protein POTOM_036971 [Populus tomentosa]|uniref:Phosphatidylinositol-3-phosphate phosphatase n=1 Tax=Populus tomentosa TaxID=118781 RepID=A0A8X8CNF4_POPTO|nr:hypothetical protein POTOM_036971 [Populus tomentosa]